LRFRRRRRARDLKMRSDFLRSRTADTAEPSFGRWGRSLLYSFTSTQLNSTQAQFRRNVGHLRTLAPICAARCPFCPLPQGFADVVRGAFGPPRNRVRPLSSYISLTPQHLVQTARPGPSALRRAPSGAISMRRGSIPVMSPSSWYAQATARSWRRARTTGRPDRRNRAVLRLVHQVEHQQHRVNRSWVKKGVRRHIVSRLGGPHLPVLDHKIAMGSPSVATSSHTWYALSEANCRTISWTRNPSASRRGPASRGPCGSGPCRWRRSAAAPRNCSPAPAGRR
jgi:hypothetical protein